ncbi:MAG: hypothetical protein WCP79_04290 [Bacillota bacterium]
MKRKIIVGLAFGLIAGIIDVTPMIMQNLTWDANLSALVMWIIAGFIIATSELKIRGVVKGILLSFLLLAPTAIIICWNQPGSMIPIVIMTLILGSGLGHAIQKFGEKAAKR